MCYLWPRKGTERLIISSIFFREFLTFYKCKFVIFGDDLNKSLLCLTINRKTGKVFLEIRGVISLDWKNFPHNQRRMNGIILVEELLILIFEYYICFYVYYICFFRNINVNVVAVGVIIIRAFIFTFILPLCFPSPYFS